jgi:3'-phosphoadenosine 5'-phosphosulfate sulfotransferase (PAPS reductase)/FAD synthetase
MKLDYKDLEERQQWSLEQKIQHSLDVISSFVTRMGGLDKVYVGFSGGRDSTVLLDLCRRIYPDILAVFCNTRNENPSVVSLVNKLKHRGGITS